MRIDAPRGLTTMIGSLPHTDPHAALDWILKCVPEAPIWPQLPKRDWREGFLPQYGEGLPGLVKHPDSAKISIDANRESLTDELTSFYEAAFAAPESSDFSRFAISTEASAGIPAALERFKALEAKPPFVKVHATGPVSFALTVFDETGKPIFFNDALAEVATQNAALNARWQVRLFRDYAEKVICFLDEPTLSAFGSSCYINVTREDVVHYLSQAIAAVHEEKAVVGVHVCGNTEWTILIDAGADILNFDAFSYGESIALYADRIGPFLEDGGALAWGVVPTSADIHTQTTENLAAHLRQLVAHLAKHGIDEDLIWRQSMITPSCGMGTMSEMEAELVMTRLAELGRIIQNEIRD